MNKKFTKLIAALALLVFMMPSLTGWGQEPTQLFHETFGNNSGSAREWNDSYSVKSGIEAVYENVVYTMTNLKQSKNTVGHTQSGLLQSSTGNDAIFEFGPLQVADYSSLSLGYYWNAGSIKGTYSTHIYYKTSPSGQYSEISHSAQGATTFVPVNVSLPVAAQTNTLFLKIVWNTSNTQAVIDEVNITGVSSGGGDTPTHAYTLSVTGADDDAEVALYVDGEELGADDEIAEGKTVTVSVIPSDGYTYSVAVKDADNVDVEYDEEMDSFTMPDSDVTITVTTAAIPTHTITFNAGSGTCGTSSQTYYEGTVITEFPTATPSAACASNGWTFVGWATASANDLTSNPTISSYEVTGTATLHAVYKLMSAGFDNTEGGEFVIYANVSGTKYYATGGVGSKKLESTTNPSLATSYTFEKQSDGVYKINDGSNYIGSSGSADLNTTETGWTIESSNSNCGSWKVWADNSRALLFREGSYYCFKNYATASACNGEYYYLEIDGGSATYATSPSCNPIYTITLNQSTGGTIEADYATAEAGQPITLSYTGLDDCYTFDGWTVTPSVTWTGDNTFTMPASAVTVSATFNQKKFTVNYSVNGTIESELIDANIDCGDNAELWTVEEMAIVGVELPTGCTFLGWSTAANSTTTVSSFTPTENATLYAVLHVNSSASVYELVTSASQITAGKYLFAALRSTTLPDPIKYSIATGSISTGNNSKDMEVTSDKFEPINNVFTSIPEGGVEFELTGNNTDGFVISYNSQSLGFSSSQSRNLAFGNYSYLWKFYDLENGLSEGAIYMHTYSNYTNYTVSENSTATGAIRGYSGQTKYRGFYLFKKSEGQAYTLVKEISSAETLPSIEETYLVTVKNGGVLTLTGPNNGDETNLIIEDGGQLYSELAVDATVQKNIIGRNNGGGWNFLASPIFYDADPSIVGMLTGDYDLYRFNPLAEPDDQGKTYEWENYKIHSSDFSLYNGHGYLYANLNDVTLEFAGVVNSPDAEVSYDYDEDSESGLKDWHLVGNPYMYKAYPNTSYYVVSGSGIAEPEISGAVAPCEGIMIQGTDGLVNFTRTPENAAQPSDLQMTLAQQVINRGTVSSTKLDKAIISFNEGSQLGKFYFGESAANIYIPQANEDYAIVSTEAQGEMPVNFRAAENGTYTITVNPENVEMNYLHLIDNMTGMDIDLLQTPSYTFNATTRDYESRFRLVFAANNNNEDGPSTGSGTFAFYSNGNWIINNAGEATLQVIDLTGRILSSETVNGSVSTTINATPGVYMLRLINGENVNVQKIVVR